MKLKILALLVVLVGVGLLVATQPVLAGPLTAATAKLNAAVGSSGLQSDITVSIGTIIRAILSLVGTIFLVLTVYAGILWMTAQGSAEVVEKAQSIITAAVTGLVITMAAYAITSFVTGRLGGAANPGAPAQTDDCTPNGGLCVKGSCGQGGKQLVYLCAQQDYLCCAKP